MPAVKTGDGPWGAAIKYWLPKRNMRLADLARATKISEKTLGRMARGFPTTTSKLDVVRRVLKVPFEHILVSPDQLRANELFEQRIREAVAAAIRESTAPPVLPPGYDALNAAVTEQTTAEEAREAPTVKPAKKRRRRH